MIDIHSHIISGIDDGSKNTEMTIKMLEMAEESGTTDIVATPHFMRGRFEVTYKEVIDEVLVSFFKSPKSYTTENMCEINSHGGTLVEQNIIIKE